MTNNDHVLFKAGLMGRCSSRSDHVISLSLIAIIIAQLAWIVWENLLNMSNQIGYDSSTGLLHSVQMVRQGRFFIQDWVNLTGLGIDAPDPIAALYYWMSGNIMTSWGAADLTALLLLVGAFWILVSLLIKKTTARLVALNLLLCNFSIMGADTINDQGYSSMLYVGVASYSIRIFILCMFLFMVISVEKKPSWSIFIGSIVTWFFMFITGLSTGTYLLFVGIIPALVFLVVKVLWSNSRKAVSFRTWAFVIICALALMCGKWICENILQFSARDSHLSWCSHDAFWDNLCGFLFSYPEMLGAFSHTEIFTLEGIVTGFAWIIVLLSVVAGFFALYKIISEVKNNNVPAKGNVPTKDNALTKDSVPTKGNVLAKNNVRLRDNVLIKSNVPLLLICVLLVNSAILIFADTRYSGIFFQARYIIPNALIYFIFIAYLLDNCDMKKISTVALYTLIIVCILGINIQSDNEFSKNNIVKEQADVLLESIQKNDSSIVYFACSSFHIRTDETIGRIMRVLDLSRIYHTLIPEKDEKYHLEKYHLEEWGTYTYCDHPEEIDQPLLIVARHDEEENLSLFCNEYHLVDVNNEYGLYQTRTSHIVPGSLPVNIPS